MGKIKFKDIKLPNQNYILNGHTPVPEPNLMKWGRWFEGSDLLRRVGSDYLLGNKIRVSTIFLGLDHGFGMSKKPVLFETMIFGGKYNNYQKRYFTWEEAEVGHAEALKMAKRAALIPLLIEAIKNKFAHK